jgi:hypothetical protein
MEPTNGRIDHFGDESFLPAPIQRHAAVAGRRSLSCCRLQLASPPDSLTQMLMIADGVTEAGLDALLRKVALARAGH